MSPPRRAAFALLSFALGFALPMGTLADQPIAGTLPTRVVIEGTGFFGERVVTLAELQAMRARGLSPQVLRPAPPPDGSGLVTAGWSVGVFR